MSQKHLLVVGGGLGGLATSALLSARGFRVTLLEKTDRLGGVAGSVCLRGACFSGGPSCIMMPELFNALASHLGFSDDFFQLERIIKPISFTIGSARYRYSGVERVLSSPGAIRFLSYGERLRPWILSFMKGEPLPWRSAQLPYFGARFVGGLFEQAGVRSFEEKLMLSLPVSFMGLPPERAPYIFAYLAYAMYREGIYQTPGGVPSLYGRLSSFVRERGVRVVTDVAVAGLISSGRSAGGVRALDGRNFLADGVVLAVPEHARARMQPTLLGRIRESRLSGYGLSLVYCLVSGAAVRGEEHRVFVEEAIGSADEAMFRSVYVFRESEGVYTALVPYRDVEPTPSVRSRAVDAVRATCGVPLSDVTVVGSRSGEDYAAMFGYNAVFPLGFGHNWFDLLTRQSNHDRYYSNVWHVGAGALPGIGMPTVIGSAIRAAAHIDTFF